MPDYGRRSAGPRVRALARLALGSLRIWWVERPNVVITTGPFTGFPLAVLVRATGGLVIYVECSAQVVSPSRSGRLFSRLANRFYVQWPALRRHYPKAEYEGLLL